MLEWPLDEERALPQGHRTVMVILWLDLGLLVICPMPRLASASGQSLDLRHRGREGDVSVSFRRVSSNFKEKISKLRLYHLGGHENVLTGR